MLSSGPPPAGAAAVMSPAYDLGDFYDEAFEAPGRPRALYAPLMAALAEVDLGELRSRVEAALAAAVRGAVPDPADTPG